MAWLLYVAADKTCSTLCTFDVLGRLGLHIWLALVLLSKQPLNGQHPQLSSNGSMSCLHIMQCTVIMAAGLHWTVLKGLAAPTLCHNTVNVHAVDMACLFVCVQGNPCAAQPALVRS